MSATTSKGRNAPVRDAGDTHYTVPTGYVNSEFRVWQDGVQLPSGTETGSKVYMADLPLDLILDPGFSFIYFDDAGTSVVLDIGDANDDNALADNIDVATAAGSSSMMAAVDRANYGKRLWELLGYATRAAAVTANSNGKARIYATVAGANLSAATDLFWKFGGTV